MARRSTQTESLFRLRHGNATRDAVKSKSTKKPSGRPAVQRYDWQRLERFLAAWDRGHDMAAEQRRDVAEHKRWYALSIEERANELYDLLQSFQASTSELERIFEENPESAIVETLLRGFYAKQRDLELFDIESDYSPYVT